MCVCVCVILAVWILLKQKIELWHFRIIIPDSRESNSAVDISRVVPLKKQHGFLMMLAQIISVLGPLIEPNLHTFLTLLLKLAHCHHSILDNRLMVCDIVHAKRSLGTIYLLGS